MTLNPTSVNMRELRDHDKCARLLEEFSNLGVDVATVQITLRLCSRLECWRMTLSFLQHTRAAVVLESFCDLDAALTQMSILSGDGDRLVVADVALKTFEFRVVVVYAHNTAEERHFFFRQLRPFLDNPMQLVLGGDWNATLDPKLDKFGWGFYR